MSHAPAANSATDATTDGARGFWADARRIGPLTWPVFVGQLAVLGFGTIDTLLVARHAPAELAAFAVGAAAYITVFVGFMGVVLAVSPTVGQLFGAGRLAAAGDQLHQGIWLALGLSAVGSTLLAFPQPFLWLAHASPAMAQGVHSYLLALALALPAALLFTVYRAFNTAVSRPKAVMALQLGGLLLKLPLSVGLILGVPALGLPAMGVGGAGVATALAMWGQLLLALWILRRDRFYAPFSLWGRGLHAPQAKALFALLRLGLPIGGSILIEVSAFTFMALFIARLGALPVAGHQIAMNLVSLMFMLPLALANATSTLVAQRIGAGDLAHAQALSWHGVQLGVLMSVLLGSAIFIGREPVLGLYTQDPLVMAAALPLLAWLPPFHVADAVQTITAFALRAWRVATAPMLIYAGALWGVGLGGGYALAFGLGESLPTWTSGARGFWIAATLGLVLVSSALAGLMAWLLRAGGPLRQGAGRLPS